MARKPQKGKSLADVNQELAKQWHPTKNDDCTPFDVSAGSNKKVWWKCEKGVDHEWEAQINDRSSGNGCPICRGLKVVNSNSLSTLNPELANQWHPTKNGSLTPLDFTPGSSKKVWWLCKKAPDHEWESSIKNRTKGRGCPMCRGLYVVKSNCLSTTHSKLASELHPKKNGTINGENIHCQSTKRVWWQCGHNPKHEWETILSQRVRLNTGCPFCDGQRITRDESLGVKNPTLSKQWHPTKNKNLTPFDEGEWSNKLVWWQCSENNSHIWKTTINNRSKGKQCPYCTNKKVDDSNCLATHFPKLSLEWHPTKNKKLTPFDVTPGSDKKVWWLCNKNPTHFWKASIQPRTKNDIGCPFCVLTPQSRQELTITFELMLFFKIDPKGFKTRVNGKIWSIDIYVPEFNLGIEFDGSYWHKDKRALDKLKTEKLEKDGFQIMRIREEPLKPITPIDIISSLPFNAKKVTNGILNHILNSYKVEKEKIELIMEYLKKRTLQNEKRLNTYVDEILEEKSKKKQKRTTTTPKLH